MRLLAFPKKAASQENIETERMILRRPLPCDFDAWAELRRMSADFLKPFEPRWSRVELTKSSYRARLTQQEAGIHSGRGYHWFLFDREDDTTLLGGLSLTNVRRGIIESGTLGYWIGQPFANQHYMREAVTGVCEYAYSELGLHRVEAATVLENIASQKLLLASGFEQEGVARAYLKIDGEWRDHFLFARINPNHCP